MSELARLMRSELRQEAIWNIYKYESEIDKNSEILSMLTELIYFTHTTPLMVAMEWSHYFIKHQTRIHSEIPEYPGVYYAYRPNEYLYIGETNNLRKRIYQHDYFGKFKRDEKIFFNIDDGRFHDRFYRLMVETAMIIFWNPTINKICRTNEKVAGVVFA